MNAKRPEGSQRVETAASRVPRRRRSWLPYAAAVLLLGLIILGLWPRPATVEIAKVTSGPLKVSVNEEGRTRVRQRYVVYAPVAGQLRRAPFKAGAEVIKDKTVVAVIDPLSPTILDERTRTAAEARRETASAKVAKAKAELQFASAELTRFEKLYTEKTVSAQEFEAAQLRKVASDRDVAAAESDLRQAEAELAEFGKGNSKTQRSLEVLPPKADESCAFLKKRARGKPLESPCLRLKTLRNLKAAIQLLLTHGTFIPTGMNVNLKPWGRGPSPFQGKGQNWSKTPRLSPKILVFPGFKKTTPENRGSGEPG